MGHTEKNSVRAYAVRVAPESGLFLNAVGMSHRGQRTKSLRSSPLRGSKSREASSQLRG